VIGPNGAGKTTFFNVLTGVLPPTAGRVLRDGVDLTGKPVEEIVQLGISRTFQLTALFPEASALENVRIAAQARRPGRWRFLGGGRLLAETRRTAHTLLDRVGLGCSRRDPGRVPFAWRPAPPRGGDGTGAGSGNSAPRRAHSGPLDRGDTGAPCRSSRISSPTAGSPCSSSSTTWRVVFSLAHRIAVLHRGRLISMGSPEAVRADPAVQEAYLGGVD